MCLLQVLFGRRLRQLREQKGLTQEKLAEKADITWRYLIDVEKGKYSPSFRTIENLAIALKVEAMELFDFRNLG